MVKHSCCQYAHGTLVDKVWKLTFLSVAADCCSQPWSWLLKQVIWVDLTIASSCIDG